MTTSFLEHRALDSSTNDISSSLSHHLQRHSSGGGLDFPTPGAMSANDDLTSNVDHDHEIDRLCGGSNSESASVVSDESRELFEPRCGRKDILSAHVCNTSLKVNAEIESPFMFANDLPVMDDQFVGVDRLSTSNQNMFNCLDPFELVS
jgi:hypothetical protein